MTHKVYRRKIYLLYCSSVTQYCEASSICFLHTIERSSTVNACISYSAANTRSSPTDLHGSKTKRSERKYTQYQQNRHLPYCNNLKILNNTTLLRCILFIYSNLSLLFKFEIQGRYFMCIESFICFRHTLLKLFIHSYGSSYITAFFSHNR